MMKKLHHACTAVWLAKSSTFEIQPFMLRAISPYFEIVKPTIEKGFDYKHLTRMSEEETCGNLIPRGKIR